MVNSLSWPLIDRDHDAAIAGEGNREIGRDVFLLYMAWIDEMYIPDWKNFVRRRQQTINDTTQWFAGKHLNYLLICILKAVHLQCLSVLISHFVRPSLMYPIVNELLVAGLSVTE